MSTPRIFQSDLIQLVKGEDIAAMREHLDAGGNPDTRDREGLPAVYHAAGLANPEPLRMLLEYGADPNLCTPHSVSPLLRACASEGTEKVKLLLEAGADPNGTLSEAPLLHWAAIHGHAHNLELIVRHGADLSATDPLGNLAIHAAVRNLPCLMTLVSLGADLETRRHDGQTVLQVAIDHGRVDAVRFLLEAGAKLPAGVEDEEYWETILDGADDAQEEDMAMIRRLVRATQMARSLASVMGEDEDEEPTSSRSSGPSPL